MTLLRIVRHTRFIPLDFSAKTTFHCVLYYDTRAPLEDIYECAMGRLDIAMSLLYEFYDCKEPNETAVSAVARAVNVLIGEGCSLLRAFDPQKLKDK